MLTLKTPNPSQISPKLTSRAVCSGSPKNRVAVKPRHSKSGDRTGIG
jgi:hypothetical protein